MTTTHLHLGRVYEVETASNIEAANQFLKANPGYGVLSVLGDGKIVMAAIENSGVRWNDAPFRVRASLSVH